MNRRTFLKSTAISLLPPTFLLKGENPLKPLQWTLLSSKRPPKKEPFLMAEKYKGSISYAIGTRHGENTIFLGKCFFDEEEIGEGLRKSGISYWIKIDDIVKHMKKTPVDYLKTPFNQLKVNMNVIEVKQNQQDNTLTIVHAGKVKSVEEHDIAIESKFDKITINKLFLYQSFNEGINIKLIELPQL